MTNPFPGITAATSVAQLDGLRRNARLQEAINLKTAARIYGVTAPPDEDEMLAGGNITVNHPASSWPVVAVLALAILAAAAGITWFVSLPRPVAPTVPTPPAASNPNTDFIEFYRP